ncbi:MAG TPA: hormogonium polysaccharide biosynthesis glycosyltransferase HpsP [Coleofasciculaceae cyanobacterium]
MPESSALRVLQIVPSVSLVYGGPSQMVLGLSQALAEAGASVTLLTTDSNGDSGQAPLDVPIGQAVAQDGYTMYYFRCAPWRRYKFSIALLWWLWTHAQDFDVAHIHALFSPISTAAAIVCRWRGLPYVLRPLGTLDPLDLRKKSHLKQWYGWLFERRNLAKAAAVHFTSAEEAKVSERFGAITRDWVIPLGVPLPPVVTRTPTEQPTVLFMSRLDRKKGLDIVIPALETLAVSGVPFRFVLAGANVQDPDYEQSIADYLSRSHLSDRTEIVGFVTGEQKRQLLAQSDLFVLPSYYENFGIAVAEAMAAGIPVVISNQVHIWPDVADSRSGWICTCDVSSFAGAVREALSQPAERQRRGQNARACTADRYSWSAIARQLIAAYHDIRRNR